MAEYVQQSVEELLPELEQMERVGLFTDKEIRQILKKRKVFEYKLRRQTKMKDDYLHYIQYEINMLALVRKRREKIGYTYKKLEIDLAIIQRIHKLFRLAVMRFKDDVKLWQSHIEFCKQRKEKSAVSRLFTKMLQVHNKKPELWIAAAKWEFETNNNSDNARSLFQRGLQFNPKSKTLWLEYYRFELLYTERTCDLSTPNSLILAMGKTFFVLMSCSLQILQMRKRLSVLDETQQMEEVSDAVLQGKVADVVYRQTLEAIPDDVNLILSFIQICQKFDFTSEQEETIFSHLKEKYSDKPLTWDALAKRHLRGKIKGPEGVNKEMMFHAVYEEAVNSVPGEEIWSLYIKACIDLTKEKGKKSLKSQRVERALLVFEEAKDAGFLSGELWLKWLDMLQKTGIADNAVEMASLGTEQFPASVDLWKKRLELLIDRWEPVKQVQNLLKEAQTKVPTKETWPLIQLVLDYNNSEGAADDAVKLLESSLFSCKEVCVPAKDKFLELEYNKHGISHARQVYDRLAPYNPVGLQFFLKYIELEASQGKTNIKHMRKAYEDALRQYGKVEPDVWLGYIKLESNHSEGSPENAGKIHFRAVKTLEGAANQEFIKKYTLMQTVES